MTWYRCPVRAARPAGALTETEWGCPKGLDELCSHLVAGPKMKLLRRLVVLVDDPPSFRRVGRRANDAR